MSDRASLQALRDQAQPDARRTNGVSDLATMFGIGGRPTPHSRPTAPARGDGSLPTLTRDEAFDVH